MKKIIIFMCVIAIMFSFCGCESNYTHEVYEVEITAEEIYNHHVGNDWKKYYSCNGENIKSGDRCTIPRGKNETRKIDITIMEEDKWPDVETDSITVSLEDNFTTSATILVTENKGKYKGNSAQWKITCKVKLVDKIKEK